MEEFKLCSDGEFMPVSLPCPPPYSGPYYYPYENIPFPPAQGITGTSSEGGGGGGGGSSVSAGAVAGIIILVSCIFFTMCICAVKFRNRSLNIFGYTLRSLRRNNEGQGAAGDQYLLNGGHEMVVNNAGGGLEKKLVSLLPVFEYVGLQGSKLQDHSFQKESSSTECAVCLSSFEEQEIVRVLPKCHHCFHVPCIDKWFESHANCPLCRETITLQSIQLYFKHPHIPNYSPDQLPAQAPGLLPDQQAAGPPAEDQDSQQPARPGADHHANNQLSTGLLMPPAGTLLSCAHPAIENQHQNDQLHSAAKNLNDRQIAGPACDHHVSDQQAAGLASPDLQGLDHHQHLSTQDVPAGAANDHRLQIDQHPENQPCPYQRIDQPARHVGGFQISDQHQKGVKGHQDLSSNASIAGAGRNDQACKADHPIELEMMRGSDQKRVHVNPKSLRGDDKKATSNTGSSDEVFLYVNDFDKKTGNSEQVVVYIGPDHPRTSFSNFKRSLSTGCLSIDRSKLRHSLLAGTAREMH